MSGHLTAANVAVSLLIGLTTLGGLAFACVRYIRPRLQDWQFRRASRREFFEGRPAVPFNELTGAPAQPAIAPAATILAELGQTLAGVHHQLHPNGGGSLLDKVTDIGKQLAVIVARLADGDQRFTDIAGQLTVILDRLAAGDEQFEEITAQLADLFARVGHLETAHAAGPADR